MDFLRKPGGESRRNSEVEEEEVQHVEQDEQRRVRVRQ